MINFLKVKCFDLLVYLVLYVMKEIFKSICFILEYINYFFLEELDF